MDNEPHRAREVERDAGAAAGADELTGVPVFGTLVLSSRVVFSNPRRRGFIIGLRMEGVPLEQLTEVLGQPEYAHVQIRRAELHPTEFRIVVRDYDATSP